MSKSWVNLSVLHISDHAAKRYRQRIARELASKAAHRRAEARIAALLKYAEPLPPLPLHDGVSQHAWKLHGCVAIEKSGTLTTILTDDMYLRGVRGDTE